MADACAARCCRVAGTVRVRLRNPRTGQPDPVTVYVCPAHQAEAQAAGLIAPLDEAPRPRHHHFDTVAPGSGALWTPPMIERKECVWCAGMKRQRDAAQAELAAAQAEIAALRARAEQAEAEADRLAEEADRLETEGAALVEQLQALRGGR